MIEQHDPRIAAGHEALDACWRRIGACDPDLISYMINPQFQGAPPWPNVRQAFRVVRPKGSLIIASDGLSDPFVGTDVEDVSGFGMEVFLETPDLVGATFEELRGSWAFPLVESFARNVADWGGIVPQLEKHGVLSLELPAPAAIPREWVSQDGTVGALVNVPASGRVQVVQLPLGPVHLVALTLLRPDELTAVVDGGAPVRQRLTARLGTHVTTLRRAGVGTS